MRKKERFMEAWTVCDSADGAGIWLEWQCLTKYRMKDSKQNPQKCGNTQKGMPVRQSKMVRMKCLLYLQDTGVLQYHARIIPAGEKVRPKCR